MGDEMVILSYDNIVTKIIRLDRAVLVPFPCTFVHMSYSSNYIDYYSSLYILGTFNPQKNYGHETQTNSTKVRRNSKKGRANFLRKREKLI